jgi:hypothetical protein
MANFSAKDILLANLTKLNSVSSFLLYSKGINMVESLKSKDCVSVISFDKFLSKINGKTWGINPEDSNTNSMVGFVIFAYPNNDLILFIDSNFRSVKDGTFGLANTKNPQDIVYDVEFCIDQKYGNNFNTSHQDRKYYERMSAAVAFLKAASARTYNIFQLDYSKFIEVLNYDPESNTTSKHKGYTSSGKSTKFEEDRDNSKINIDLDDTMNGYSDPNYAKRKGTPNSLDRDKIYNYYLSNLEYSWFDSDLYYGSFDIPNTAALNSKLIDFISAFLVKKFSLFNNRLSKFQAELQITDFNIDNWHYNPENTISCRISTSYFVNERIITSNDNVIVQKLTKAVSPSAHISERDKRNMSEEDRERLAGEELDYLSFRRHLQYLLMRGLFQYGEIYKHLFVDQSLKLLISKLCSYPKEYMSYKSCIENEFLRDSIFRL